MKGIEPPTYGLQNRCSTIELHQLFQRYPNYTSLIKLSLLDTINIVN